MGGKSTSQSAVLRGESSTRPAYDLRSWQGLTDVLRAAKQKLTPDKHAVFRDLVLRYAQQGGDAALKDEIDAVLAKLDTPQAQTSLATETVPQSQSSARPPTAPSNRMGRPVPQFAVRQSASESVVAPAPAPQPAIPNTPPPAPAPVPVPPPPAPAPMPEPKPEPVPVPPAPAFEPPAPKPVEIPRPEPMASPAPPAPKEEFSGTPRSLDEHKARIIEIKRLVNEQIGNPVALVGAHKTLGKEYMQALLTALKATGGGGVGADAAMRRLEDAYTALLTDTPETAAPSVPAPDPVPVPEPVPVVAVKEEILPPPPTPPAPLPVIEVQEPVPEVVPQKEEVLAPVKEVISEPIEVPLPVIPKPISKPPAPPIAIPRPEPKSMPQPAPARPAPASVVPPSPPRRDVVTPKPVAPNQVILSPREKVQPSAALSAAARLAALTKDVPQPAPKADIVPKAEVSPQKPAPVESSFQQTKYTQKKVGSVSVQALAASGIDTDEHEVRQSELASPKITKALHELLDEWSIFNASGFLGMGPSGAEHPLYIRLAPLSMGEILTGRYEGADRKVNTVVHDYVNAWRHEQGIAYTPSETFEHYLRRVVQRIQKRQGTPA